MRKVAGVAGADAERQLQADYRSSLDAWEAHWLRVAQDEHIENCTNRACARCDAYAREWALAEVAGW